MNLNKYYWFLLALFLSITVFSQEEKEDLKPLEKIKILDEVIITATRTIRQLSSLPLPAQIVTKSDIEKSNATRLTDILSEQTGLVIVPDHGQGIQMQGLDSDYTLVLIDGVPIVGRTAGTLDLSRITVGNIKQIEIVKGASSSLYGSEALAGVINIITEGPKQGFSGYINERIAITDIENRNLTNDLGVSINYKKGKLGITSFINKYSSDGYDLDKTDNIKTLDPFTNYTFSTKLSYSFNKKTALLVTWRRFLENQQNIPSIELSGENNLNEWNTHLKLNHKYNKQWESYFEFYATRYKTNSYLKTINTGVRSDENYYNQLLIRPEFRISYTPFNKTTFIGGLGYSHDILDRTNLNSKDPNVYNSPYVYAQYDGYPTEKLNIIAGFRYDRHSLYRSQFSPKLALRYELNKHIAIKTSIGYGYKAPDFRQLYLDWSNPTEGYNVFGVAIVKKRYAEVLANGEIIKAVVDIDAINQVLKPESSLNFNIGTQLTPINSINIDVNFFSNNITNLIDTYVIANKNNGMNIYSYRNVAQVYTKGVEANIVWKPISQLKVAAGYQYLIAKSKEAKRNFAKGEVFSRNPNTHKTIRLTEDDYVGLLNRSKHTMNAKMFYVIPKYGMDTNIRATYRSKYGMAEGINGYLDKYDTFIKGYSMWDFAINKTLYKNFKIGFGVNNILDYRDSNPNFNSISGRIIYGKIKGEL